MKDFMTARQAVTILAQMIDGTHPYSSDIARNCLNTITHALPSDDLAQRLDALEARLEAVEAVVKPLQEFTTASTRLINLNKPTVLANSDPRRTGWLADATIEVENAKEVLGATPAGWDDARDHRRLTLKHLHCAIETLRDDDWDTCGEQK